LEALVVQDITEVVAVVLDITEVVAVVVEALTEVEVGGGITWGGGGVGVAGTEVVAVVVEDITDVVAVVV
jgi:hypothetical protein